MTKGTQVHALLALASELAHEAGWALDKFQDESAAYFLAAEGEMIDEHNDEASTHAVPGPELQDPASGLRQRGAADSIRESVHAGRFARLGEARVPPGDRREPEAGEPAAGVNQDGVHATHCCTLHGCKYGDEDCPVLQQRVRQEYPCKECMNDDIGRLGVGSTVWMYDSRGNMGRYTVREIEHRSDAPETLQVKLTRWEP